MSLLVGLSASSEWQAVLLYRNAQPFGVTDPLFQRDVAFYVFQLPLWQRGLGWILAMLVLALVLTALVYFLGRVLVLTARGPVITARARAHLLVLLALLLFAKAIDFWLDRYDLLYSQRGAVLGATYTDVHATLPALGWLAVLAVLCGLTALVHVFRRSTRPVLAGLVVLAVGWIGGLWAFPTLVQRLRVAPNALVAESPYIAHHIQLTRRAFALDRIEERDFPARETLTAADLARNARDAPERPALGPRAAAPDLRPAAGDPDLLPLRRRGQRPLRRRRRVPAGDAVRARALLPEPAARRAGARRRPPVDQRAPPVHARLRRGRRDR